MRAALKDYGCYPFVLAGFVFILGFQVYLTWEARKENRRFDAAAAELQSFRTSLADYNKDNECVPTTAQGLDALLRAPTIAPLPKNWRGPYRVGSFIPLDPWGKPYVYRNPGVRNPGGYELLSSGPDGEPETQDDITYP